MKSIWSGARGSAVAVGVWCAAIACATTEPAETLDLGNLGAEGIKELRQFAGLPDANGVLRTWRLGVPPFQSGLYFSGDSRRGGSTWPADANRILPWVVKGTYRTFGTRAMRAIEGFSMGGFGALHLAFKFPEKFGSMTALSHAPIRPNSGWEKVDRVYRDGPLAGNADTFNANDPFQLVGKNAGAIRDGMSLRFIVGDKDQPGTQARTKEFYEQTQKLGMKSTLTIVPGVAHSCPKLYDMLGGPVFGYYMRYFASVAARETSESTPKYAGLSPAPFGKGIFAHVRAGGKIRASDDTIRTWARNPYIAGTQLSYCWSELELREGEYRWDVIEKDMEIWAQYGKKCWLEVSTAFR